MRGLFCLLLCLECSVGSLSAEEPRPQTIAIATYNINWGNPNLPQLVKTLRAADADVVCLQETTAASERFLQHYLAERYPHIEFHGHDGKFAAERFGFLSKLPLDKLAYYPPKHGLFGFYCAIVKSGETTIRIVNVHLDPWRIPRNANVGDAFASFSNFDRTHDAEAERILDTLDGDLPTIVAGDFNSLAKQSAAARLKKAGFTDSFASVTENPEQHPTWHWRVRGVELRLRIDFIFHKGGFTTRESKIFPGEASDHFLLKSVLTLPQNGSDVLK